MPIAAVISIACVAEKNEAAPIHFQAAGEAFREPLPKKGSIARENRANAANCRERKLSTPKSAAHIWRVTSVNAKQPAQPSASNVRALEALRLQFDDPRQLEQFRTDGQALAACGVGIDLETDLVALGDEVDDATVFGKTLDFTDSENF